MSTYRDFVKEMMPKMMGYPPKERMKMVAKEWGEKKLKGGWISAAGLEKAGYMSAAGLSSDDMPSKKKAQKSDLSEVSSKTPPKRLKALGGFMAALKMTLPVDMKDSHILSKVAEKKMIDHIAVEKGHEFANDIVKKLFYSF